MLRRRDEEQHSNQLSPSFNRASGDSRDANSGEGSARAELGYKLKPDNYDGLVPLRKFFSQFNLIARANNRSNSTKSVALASCLRGKAGSVLETFGNSPFVSTKKKLQTVQRYIRDLRLKLQDIHSEIRERLGVKTSSVKARYDLERVFYFKKNKKWLFNPRKEKRKTPKLQSNLEGRFVVVRKLSEMVYVRMLVMFKNLQNKIVHADRLAHFYERKG